MLTLQSLGLLVFLTCNIVVASSISSSQANLSSSTLSAAHSSVTFSQTFTHSSTSTSGLISSSSSSLQDVSSQSSISTISAISSTNRSLMDNDSSKESLTPLLQDLSLKNNVSTKSTASAKSGASTNGTTTIEKSRSSSEAVPSNNTFLRKSSTFSTQLSSKSSNRSTGNVEHLVLGPSKGLSLTASTNSSIHQASNKQNLSVAVNGSFAQAVSVTKIISTVITASSTRLISTNNTSILHGTSGSFGKSSWVNSTSAVNHMIPNDSKAYSLNNTSVLTNTSLNDTALASKYELHPILYFEEFPDGGGYTVNMEDLLAQFITPDLSDQSCANGHRKRGPSTCSSMKCVERNVLKALSSLSSNLNMVGYLQHISPNYPTNFPRAWATSLANIQQVASTSGFFYAWSTVQALVKTWTSMRFTVILALFSAEIQHLEKWQETLETVAITTSLYTCTVPAITSTSATSCPSLTFTTSRPTPGTTVIPGPCGSIGQCWLAPRPDGQYPGQGNAKICQEGTVFEFCDCSQSSDLTSGDAPLNETQLVAQANAASFFQSAALEQPNCLFSSQNWQGTAQEYCVCGAVTSVHYPTIIDTNTALACAYTEIGSLPEPLPVSCVVSPSGAPSGTGDDGNQYNLTSWLVSDRTTTECSTGQTAPTPTVTTPPGWSRNNILNPPYSWGVYAGSSCGPDNFPLPTYAAIMAGNDYAYAPPCQTIQHAEYFGKAFSVEFNTNARSRDCVTAFIEPGCTGASYTFCATPSPCNRVKSPCTGPTATGTCMTQLGLGNDTFDYTFQAVKFNY